MCLVCPTWDVFTARSDYALSSSLSNSNKRKPGLSPLAIWETWTYVYNGKEFYVLARSMSYLKSGGSLKLRCYIHSCQICVCFPIPWQYKYAPDHSWSRTIHHVSANVARAHNCSVDTSSMAGPGESWHPTWHKALNIIWSLWFSTPSFASCIGFVKRQMPCKVMTQIHEVIWELKFCLKSGDKGKKCLYIPMAWRLSHLLEHHSWKFYRGCLHRKIHQAFPSWSLPFLTWASWQETIKREKLIRILLTLLKHGGHACVTGTGELLSF